MKFSFSEECLPHYPEMLEYAAKLTRDRSSARDVVQTAYTRVLSSWSSYSPSSELPDERRAVPYLYQTVYASFVDTCRKSKRHRDFIKRAIDEDLVPTSSAPEPSDDPIGPECEAAIAELDTDQRDIVMRIDVNGESYLAVATSLGIPIGTVMSRLNRARNRLAAILSVYARAEYSIGSPLAAGAGARKHPLRRPSAQKVKSDADGVHGIMLGRNKKPLGRR